MRTFRQRTAFILVYYTALCFALSDHTRRHASDYVAVSSKLGHDLSKPQKDARNIFQVKAQTGSTAILHCNIDVGPNVPIYWAKQPPNSPIVTVDNRVIITDRRFRISNTDSSLHILLTKPEDEGLYSCKTGDDEANSQKHYVRLSLQEAYAEILLPPGHRSISVKMGSPLRMSCLLHNLLEQPSYIFWYHGDRMINYVLTGGASVRHGRKGSELKIPRAQPSDAGDYMCVPSNARHANVYVNVTVPKREKYAARVSNSSKMSAWLSHWFCATLLALYFYG